MLLVALTMAAHAGTWAWNPAPDLYPNAAIHSGDVSLAAPVADDRPLTLSRAGGWSVELSMDHAWRDLDGAALAVAGDRAYIAHYNRISSGCELLAVDLDDGSRLWTVSLEGLGPISHSKYSNRVQLRVEDGRPVVYGHEASGRYIEARDPATGALVSNERLEWVAMPRNPAEDLYREVERQLRTRASYEVDLRDFLARHVLPAATPIATAAKALHGVVMPSGAMLHIAVDGNTLTASNANR